MGTERPILRHCTIFGHLRQPLALRSPPINNQKCHKQADCPTGLARAGMVSEVIVIITGHHFSLQVEVPRLPQKSGLMVRRSDVFGLAGVLMLLFGAWFIFARLYPLPLWITWIVGPTLWYVGVSTTVVWLLRRVYGLKSSAAGK